MRGCTIKCKIAIKIGKRWQGNLHEFLAARRFCFCDFPDDCGAQLHIFCTKLEKEKLVAGNLTTISNLSLTDEEFVCNVAADIDQFLKKRHVNGVLLFPPVNNFRRFLIHQTCENFRQQYDLFTFSVGQGPFRRTVVCFKNQLLDPHKFADTAAAANFETRKKSPVKSWRSERKIETTNSYPTITSRTRDKNPAGKMGVEKTSNDSRLHKMNSVDLYRPPALRTQNSIETADTRVASMQAAITSKISVTTSGSTISDSTTTATSISCNNSPVHVNENASSSNNIDNSATSANSVGAKDDAVIAQNGQQRQQTARRERRPDRAVYIPRARRSQTTPPTATTTTTSPPVTAQSQATATTTICSNTGTSNIQQLAITAALVSTTPSSKTDEVGKSTQQALMKKSKSLGGGSGGSNNKERKERVRKSAKNCKLSVQSPETETTLIIIAQSKTENSKVSNSDCDNRKQMRQAEAREKSATTNATIESLENLQNSGLLKTCGVGGGEQVSMMATSEKNKTSKCGSVSANSNNNEKCPNVNSADNLTNLRIEDIASSENARSAAKCDIDVQEFQRASKEINRSNRRIIKQTFVSDVLEIPDKITENYSQVSNAHKVQVNALSVATASSASRSAIDSTTEEEEEDDWENMFDESGECLDPKIMQELTASVGKVKIELPKMDYSAYLTKQSILNDEEFPHVLEVSNFPTEFKNQDLLMVFSQYKESGFDIKWVDDTHALAVFSSSRIAAEVLTMGHPFVVLKPLAEATVESRLKAKKCAASLQPYRPRPETCAALARRLVTGALGVKLKTAAAERENEKRVLREAKERKLLAAKQRDEAWES